MPLPGNPAPWFVGSGKSCARNVRPTSCGSGVSLITGSTSFAFPVAFRTDEASVGMRATSRRPSATRMHRGLLNGAVTMRSAVLVNCCTYRAGSPTTDALPRTDFAAGLRLALDLALSVRASRVDRSPMPASAAAAATVRVKPLFFLGPRLGVGGTAAPLTMTSSATTTLGGGGRFPSSIGPVYVTPVAADTKRCTGASPGVGGCV
mmetsp:Transcript_12049/g.37473  ORF Transcript_12049/g.37473 Transcript_12049/m.37473 type:complete len:206 (+) Transcript_12049:611-1228(+)